MESDLVMDLRLTWNPLRLKEIDEAKVHFMDYKRQGYEILGPDGTVVERFHPSFGEVVVKTKKVLKHMMKILCDKGDERLTWDREEGTEAKQAKKRFEDLLSQGYKAYSVDEKGKKNRRIEEFDVDAQELLMIPPTSKG